MDKVEELKIDFGTWSIEDCKKLLERLIAEMKEDDVIEVLMKAGFDI